MRYYGHWRCDCLRPCRTNKLKLLRTVKLLETRAVFDGFSLFFPKNETTEYRKFRGTCPRLLWLLIIFYVFHDINRLAMEIFTNAVYSSCVYVPFAFSDFVKRCSAYYLIGFKLIQTYVSGMKKVKKFVKLNSHIHTTFHIHNIILYNLKLGQKCTKKYRNPQLNFGYFANWNNLKIGL